MSTRSDRYSVIEDYYFVCMHYRGRSLRYDKYRGIAVNRAYNKSDYIPCIAWGRNARFVQNLGVGDRIAVSGRIQSREYQKKLSDTDVKIMTAYEVSVSKLAAFDAGEDFDIDSEFDLYSLQNKEQPVASSDY